MESPESGSPVAAERPSEAAALRALVDRVRAGDVEAAREVRRLTRASARHRRKLAPAVEPLVAMLRSGKPKAGEAALLALLNLAVKDERMEQQVCWRKGFQNIGFMDPYMTHEFSIQKYPKTTTRNIWTFLEKQKDCDFILFSYNNHFHWMLLVIKLKKSVVVVLDTKRKKQVEFQDVTDLMNKAWAHFITEHKGPFKEKLHIRTDFPCMREEVHEFVRPDGPMTPQEFNQIQMAECLIPTEGIKAVQEQLCGFLMDEVVDPKGEFHNDGSWYKPHVGFQDEDKTWP